MRTNKGDYFIEPSKHHTLTHDGHPHVVFQRSAVSNSNSSSSSNKSKVNFQKDSEVKFKEIYVTFLFLIIPFSIYPEDTLKSILS